MITTITDNKRGRIVKAEYQGGPYIDLTFGGYGTHADEVINVWDYETDKPEPHMVTTNRHGQVVPNRQGLRDEVRAWMATQNQEWPEWYEGYMENKRV